MECQERICKLCLEKCESFKVIDGNIKNILDKLLQKIDFTLIQEPAMCKNCAEMLIKGFDFKTACLRIRDSIVPFVNTKASDKLDLKDIYLNKDITGTGVPEDQDVCVFCMGLVKKCSIISFDVEDGNVTLKEMIEQCLPELDLSIFKEQVICATCYESLENCFRFVKNCLIVEENTKKCQTLDVDSKSQIELSSFLQFTMSDIATSKVGGSSVAVIKAEEHFCGDRKNPDEMKIGTEAEIIKLEEMFFEYSEDVNEYVENENKSFIKADDQKVYNEHQVTPKNMLACEEDSNKLGTMELEDQKFLLDEEIEIKTDNHDFSGFEDGILSHPEIATRLRESPKCLKFNCAGDLSKGPSEVAMFKCDYCSYQTRHKTNLNRHLKDPLTVARYKCDLCSFQTKYNNCLKQHLLLHKGALKVAVYKCDSCSFQSKHIKSLEEHLLVHEVPSELTMYKCDFCLFQSKCKIDLKSHLLVHKDPSKAMYKCDSCSYKTKCKNKLITHLLRIKDPPVSKYKCESCSFQTKYKQYLTKHVLMHKAPLDVKMYKCGSCSYETKDKHYLKTHVLKHKDPSEVTMYKCDYCTFRTKYERSLRKHKLKHKNPSEVTVYRCDACSFRSKYDYSLKVHLQSHKNSSKVTI